MVRKVIVVVGMLLMTAACGSDGPLGPGGTPNSYRVTRGGATHDFTGGPTGAQLSEDHVILHFDGYLDPFPGPAIDDESYDFLYVVFSRNKLFESVLPMRIPVAGSRSPRLASPAFGIFEGATAPLTSPLVDVDYCHFYSGKRPTSPTESYKGEVRVTRANPGLIVGSLDLVVSGYEHEADVATIEANFDLAIDINY